MANKLQHSQNLVVPCRSEEILRHYNVQKEKRSRSPSLVLHQPDHYGCRSNVPGSSISHLDHNLSCNQTFDPTATSTYDKYHVALDKQLELEKSCVTKCLSDCCKKEHILREKSKLIPRKPVKYVDLGWDVHAFQRTNKCKEPAPNQHEFNVNKTVASNLSELQIYGQLTDCECQDMDLSSEPTEESLTLIAKRENDCEKNEKEYLNSYEPTSGFQNDPKQAMFFKNSSTIECQADKENQSLFKNGQNWYHQPSFPSVLPMNNTGTFNQQSNSVFPTLRLFNSARPSPMNIMTQQAAPKNIITQQAAPILPNNFGLRDDFMIHSIYPSANRFPVFNGSLLNQNLWRGMINPHQRPAFLVGGFNQPNTSQLVLENFIKQFLGFGKFFPPY
ncbi:hypothetical protein RRG08_005670 [Elysia crispata]|uniref:Uncharacterized protein n=1 Tax=Elysia crispata TaxID=231223 RepID=A0AAE0YDE7_9GAST|nr:hypothetical protein RRG08_005670 [Elysia crispata]